MRTIAVFDHSGGRMTQFLGKAPAGWRLIEPIKIGFTPHEWGDSEQRAKARILLLDAPSIVAFHRGTMDVLLQALLEDIGNDQMVVELSGSAGIGEVSVTRRRGLYIRAPFSYDQFGDFGDINTWLVAVWGSRELLYRRANEDTSNDYTLTSDEERRIEGLGFPCKRQIGQALTILCRGVLVAWAASEVTLRPQVVKTLGLPSEAVNELFKAVEDSPTSWEERLKTVQDHRWWANVFGGDRELKDEWQKSLRDEFARRKLSLDDSIERLVRWIAGAEPHPLSFEEMLLCFQALNATFGKSRDIASGK